MTCNAIRPSAATRLTTESKARAAWEAAGLGDIWGRKDRLSPESVASLVVFLASDQAAGITGQTFRVLAGEIGVYTPPAIGKSARKTGRWTFAELRDLVPGLIGAVAEGTPKAPEEKQ